MDGGPNVAVASGLPVAGGRRSECLAIRARVCDSSRGVGVPHRSRNQSRAEQKHSNNITSNRVARTPASRRRRWLFLSTCAVCCPTSAAKVNGLTFKHMNFKTARGIYAKLASSVVLAAPTFIQSPTTTKTTANAQNTTLFV